MSILNLKEIQGLIDNNYIISLKEKNILKGVDGGSIYHPGSILQTVYKRTDSRTTYSCTPVGTGTALSALDVVITPKQVGSKIHIQWMLNYEVNADFVFLIHKNGELITTEGEEGLNSNELVFKSSGYAISYYDLNDSTTPSNLYIQYTYTPTSLDPITFSIAGRSSGVNNSIFYLNRVFAGIGQDTYENMISNAIAWEVAQ